MKSTRAFVEHYIRQAYKHGDAWILEFTPNEDDDYEERKIKHALAMLDIDYDLNPDTNPELAEYISVGKSRDLSRLLAFLSRSLHADLNEWTKYQYKDILDKVILALAPTGSHSAYCLNKDDNKQPLDGYAVFINQGLYFCLDMLAKAQLVETLGGDYDALRKDGFDEYCSAIRFFLRNTKDDINKGHWSGLTAEQHGELSAIQSKTSNMVLTFIGLHELGHIVNGDLDLMDTYRLYASGVMNNRSQVVESDHNKHLNEYKADEFAIKAICEHASSPMSAWANFTPIYLFFKWLSDCEKLYGAPLSNSHPPPLKRAERLYQLMIDVVGQNSEVADYLDWLLERSDDWFSHITLTDNAPSD